MKGYKDPFMKLYGEIQEVWNDKKGLDYGANPKKILIRLRKFSDSLPEVKKELDQEINLLERIYIK